MHIKVQYTFLLALFLALSGCATLRPERLGSRVEQAALPPGAPAPEVILADLAKNDAAIQNFHASGKFILKSPQLKETVLLPQSTILFRRPADLSVSGRKMGTPVGRLLCKGEEFLLEAAIDKNYLHSERGARFEGISREVSPADIARETFLPEDWSALGPARVRMVDYREVEQRATFEVLDARGRKVHRRVEVHGPPWTVTRSELFDEHGATLAVTTKDDYRDNGGVRFPAHIRSEFPGEDAFMEFDMREFSFNEEISPATFDIAARLGEIEKKGYVPMETKQTGNKGRLK